jgi:hypothetical protein
MAYRRAVVTQLSVDRLTGSQRSTVAAAIFALVEESSPHAGRVKIAAMLASVHVMVTWVTM